MLSKYYPPLDLSEFGKSLSKRGLPLSPTELIILQLGAKGGYSRNEIAVLRQCTSNTVKNHIACICKKLDKHSFLQCILWYLDAGIRIKSKGTWDLSFLMIEVENETV